MPERKAALQKLEARALNWLARREYTRKEMAAKLSAALRTQARAEARGLDTETRESEAAPRLADDFAPAPARRAGSDDGDGLDADAPEPRLGADDIDTLLDRLEARRLLSDQRAAEAIVHVRRGQRGVLRIAHELEQKGVAPELATEALSGLSDLQIPLAREVWRKRFGVLPAEPADRARQTRFLASRGFSFDVIRAVLGGDEGEL